MCVRYTIGCHPIRNCGDSRTITYGIRPEFSGRILLSAAGSPVPLRLAAEALRRITRDGIFEIVYTKILCVFLMTIVIFPDHSFDKYSEEWYSNNTWISGNPDVFINARI